MWLYIDTSERGSFRVAKIPRRGKAKAVTAPGLRLRFIPWLSSFMPRAAFQKCEGIIVVEGPGSFSSIRAGVLVANMVARLVNKPLYRLAKADVQDLADIQKGLIKRRFRPVSYVAPVYDREPNITCPT